MHPTPVHSSSPLPERRDVMRAFERKGRLEPRTRKRNGKMAARPRDPRHLPNGRVQQLTHLPPFMAMSTHFYQHSSFPAQKDAPRCFPFAKFTLRANPLPSLSRSPAPHFLSQRSCHICAFLFFTFSLLLSFPFLSLQVMLSFC
jgi:hypothetical protein